MADRQGRPGAGSCSGIDFYRTAKMQTPDFEFKFRATLSNGRTLSPFLTEKFNLLNIIVKYNQ